MDNQIFSDPFVRNRAIQNDYGICSATRQNWVNQGLLTRPVHLSAQMVATPRSEHSALLAARRAGQSEDFIKSLVKQLHGKRNAEPLDSVEESARELRSLAAKLRAQKAALASVRSPNRKSRVGQEQVAA